MPGVRATPKRISSCRNRQPDRTDSAPADDDERHESLTSRLGPGLITGAADDDPSGIATYSQAGAQFRFALVWTLFLTTPLMIGIQMLSARIGWVTREGLATNIDKICPRWLTVSLIGLLVVANTINIAADVGAMAEAVKLLVGGPQPLYVLAIGAICIAMQVFFSYERTVRVLKWLTLALFAYVAVVLVGRRCRGRRRSSNRCGPGHSCRRHDGQGVRGDGRRRARHDDQPLPVLLAGDAGGRGQPAPARGDSACATTRPTPQAPARGSSWTPSSAWAFRTWSRSCIVVATAVTLNEHGIVNIQTSAQAAEALRPVAGEFAFLVFGARHHRHRAARGAGARRLGGVRGERAVRLEGRACRAASTRRAASISIIIAATGIGSAMGFFDVDPIKALVLSAIVNGVISVPIMVVMMMIGQSKKLMGRFTISPRHRFFGWSATLVMAAAVAVMFATGF